MKPVNLSVRTPWTIVESDGKNCWNAVATIQTMIISIKGEWLVTWSITFCPAATASRGITAWSGASNKTQVATKGADLKNRW